jgi:hypothetical protein
MHECIKFSLGKIPHFARRMIGAIIHRDESEQHIPLWSRQALRFILRKRPRHPFYRMAGRSILLIYGII